MGLMERVVTVLVATAIVVLFGLLVVVGVNECRDKDRCRRAGGTVEQVNCREVTTLVSCGTNCMIPVTTTECDWHCVGASGELP